LDSSFEPAESERAIDAALAGRGVEPPLRSSLARYGRLVLEANRRLNVTGARTSTALAEQLTDSLTVVPFVAAPYLDVGSGAGFPAIPVALASGVEPTMVEATLKKARFLESLLPALGLSGSVVAERAELAAHREDLREQFSSVTCRAVAGAAASAELTLPFLKIGGLAILQRGAMEREERVALDDALLVLNGAVEAEVMLEGARRLVLLRKNAATHGRFPRRPGIPSRRPLCQ
jgi:16S rRNA (guanine527-N7)-methyltransferase